LQTSIIKIVLIPAYEPSDLLTDLIRRLQKAGFQVIVVDDGSGEKSNHIFKEAGRFATVLTHEQNLGKGCALKTGLAYIKEYFPENSIIVTMDADGQHRVEDAVRCCEAAAAEGEVLVLGCRSFGGGVPARSRLGNSITRFVYRLFTGTEVSDTQTGLRAFGFGFISFMLGVSGERYEYEMNVLLECSRQNIPIKEIGIETIYFAGNAASHFNTVKDSFSVYKEILKFAASSLTGFLVDYGLYSLLVIITKGLGAAISIPLSNIVARVISASVNFSINKHLVFANKDSAVKTASEYFVLASCILAANTLILSLLVNKLGINKFIAKIFTEITFFTFSWLAQKFLIFRKKKVSV